MGGAWVWTRGCLRVALVLSCCSGLGMVVMWRICTSFGASNSIGPFNCVIVASPHSQRRSSKSDNSWHDSFGAYVESSVRSQVRFGPLELLHSFALFATITRIRFFFRFFFSFFVSLRMTRFRYDIFNRLLNVGSVAVTWWSFSRYSILIDRTSKEGWMRMRCIHTMLLSLMLVRTAFGLCRPQCSWLRYEYVGATVHPGFGASAPQRRCALGEFGKRRVNKRFEEALDRKSHKWSKLAVVCCAHGAAILAILYQVTQFVSVCVCATWSTTTIKITVELFVFGVRDAIQCTMY